MRRLTLVLVVVLLGAACGDSAVTTTTTAAPEATTAATQPPATTQPSATTQATTTTTLEVAPTGPETVSFEDLIGTWRAPLRGSFMQLNEDGTYRIALSTGDIENTKVEQGQFTFEGTLFTFISDQDSQNCAEGQRGRYEMEVLEEGPSGNDRLRMNLVEDECSIRGGQSTTIERVSAAPEGEYVFYEDPENDCRTTVDNTPAPVCMPASTDILSVELTRAGPLTIVIEIAAPGEPELGTDYSMALGLDRDRDAATGSRSWSGHGIGPELEVDYFVTESEVSTKLFGYSPDGSPASLAASGAQWEWLDPTHLQVVIDMDVVGDRPFGIAGDLTTGNHYDHFVDGGHLLFPEGDVG